MALYRFSRFCAYMPSLKELMFEPVDPVFRLTVMDGEINSAPPQTEDAMSQTLGINIAAASIYGIWKAVQLWGMAGGSQPPLKTASMQACRVVDEQEFTDALVASLNELLGFPACRRVGRDCIRADGREAVALVLDKILYKDEGSRLLKGAISRMSRRQ